MTDAETIRHLRAAGAIPIEITNVPEVSALNGAQTATSSPDPTWGLHLLGANIALRNLLTDVRTKAAAFAVRPSAPLVPSTH